MNKSRKYVYILYSCINRSRKYVYILYSCINRSRKYVYILYSSIKRSRVVYILYLCINRSSKYREYIATQSEIALEIATQLGALEPAEGEEDIEDEVERSTLQLVAPSLRDEEMLFRAG